MADGHRIRAKVQVQEIRQHNWTQQDRTVVMSAVHGGSDIPEALQYSRATPSGRIELQMKKEVADLFPMGAYVTVDMVVHLPDEPAQA